MADFETRRKQALDACDKCINGIEDGTINVSSALLLCMKIARLVNDTEGQVWLEYEHNGYPRTKDGHITAEGWKIAKKYGRVYLNQKDKKEYMFTELAAELEEARNSMRSALGNYTTQGFSVSGEYSMGATNNLALAVSQNTNALLESIKTNENHLQILKSQYYDYALRWQIELCFGNISKAIFDEYRENVDRYYSQLPTTTVRKLNAIEDLVLDGNPERYAQVLTSCRRLWADMAKQLFDEVLPDYKENTYITKSGKEIDISGDHYNNKLSAVIETLQSKATENTLVGSTIVYLIDWMEQINNRQSSGVHSEVTKNEAMQCIIHTYIALGDILRLKNDVDRN